MRTTPAAPLRTAALLLGALGLLATSACPAQTSTGAVPLPDTDPKVAPVIVSTKERQVARQYLQLVLNEAGLVTDVQLSEYVANLMHKLARNAGIDSSNYQIFIVDDSSINAFAGPGGTFIFFTGLFDLSETEGEFASVLAHEMAHDSQRHLALLFEKQSALALPTLAAILGGILIGGDEGVAASVSAAATQADALIKYTHAFEREADAIGLRILAASGYHPRHAREFMAAMEQQLRMGGIRESHLHRTHPLTPERIAAVEDRLPDYAGGDYPAESVDFQLAKARAKVLYEFKPQITTKQYEKLVAEAKGDHAAQSARYGHAMSLSRDKRHEQARDRIAQLLRQHPDNAWYVLTAAEVEMGADDLQAAQKIISDARGRIGMNLALTEKLAEILIAAGQADEAKRMIRKSIIDQPDKPYLHRVHARASNEAGDKLQAHLSMSEYHYLLGRYDNALQQLKVAELYADGNFYATETIKEKRRQIGAEKAWIE